MPHVKRYSSGGRHSMQSENGIYVLYEDYRKLEDILIQTQTDNTRLMERNSELTDGMCEWSASEARVKYLENALYEIANPVFRTKFKRERAAGVSWERIYEDLALVTLNRLKAGEI